jgi:hypothetical protein
MPRIIDPRNRLKLSEKFITVLTCSNGKQDLSELIYDNNGLVEWIELNATEGLRPDDFAYGSEQTWRNIIEQNQHNGNIPFMAYQLYTENVYLMLREFFGDRFFIQSAGFGIIRSNYRLPKYNITFSSNVNDANNLRNYLPNGGDGYLDFNHLDELDNKLEDIVYVGGKSYVKQFIELTRDLPNRKVIFYIGNPIPLNNLNEGDNFIFHQYYPANPNQRTNWHYGLARDLAHGHIASLHSQITP